MHKKARTMSQKVRSKVQIAHNAKTKVVPMNFKVGKYVMIHPAKAQHKNFCSEWIGLMHIKTNESALAFEAENRRRPKKGTVQVQHMTAYQAQSSTEPLSREQREYAKYLHNNF